MKIRRSILLVCTAVVVLLVLLIWFVKKPGESIMSSVKTASAPTAEQTEGGSSQRESRLVARTNTPKGEEFSAVNVAVGPETKSERARKGLAALNNEDIGFYGKVTDQFGVPVAGAEIMASIQVNDGTRLGTEQTQLVTDSNGIFTISGYTGKALGVYATKEGYIMATTNTRFVFSHLWAESERYNPDPNSPTVIKMWKLEGAEPLMGIDQHYKFRYAGQPVYVDLLAESIVPSGGDIKITVSRSAGIVSERTLRDWSVQVEAVNGGLIKTDTMKARVTYMAPNNGYQPSDAFTMSTNAPYRWSGAIHQTYFLTSRREQVYGKIDFGLRINQDPEDEISMEISGVANTNGSRNWEATALGSK